MLKRAGFTFEVFTMDVPEEVPEDMHAREAARFLAEMKNRAYREHLEGHVLLTADTTVVCNRKILQKPTDEADARATLQELSGQSHEVVTGVCISSPEHTTAFESITRVEFKQLNEAQINHYVQHFKPFDKAGAYGIQDWIGLIGISSIEGSYYNVMGLPIDKVYDVLIADFGVVPGLEAE